MLFRNFCFVLIVLAFQACQRQTLTDDEIKISIEKAYFNGQIDAMEGYINIYKDSTNSWFWKNKIGIGEHRPTFLSYREYEDWYNSEIRLKD